MIGQGIGLRWLIPLALDVLDVDPHAGGDFFPGDLLSNVLRAPKTSWEYDSESRGRVQRILDRLGDRPKELSDAIAVFRASTV